VRRHRRTRTSRRRPARGRFAPRLPVVVPANDTADASNPPPKRCGGHYRPWAELLKRTFDIDVRCPRCEARMKLVAMVTDPASGKRVLRSRPRRSPSDECGSCSAYLTTALAWHASNDEEDDESVVVQLLQSKHSRRDGWRPGPRSPYTTASTNPAARRWRRTSSTALENRPDQNPAPTPQSGRSPLKAAWGRFPAFRNFTARGPYAS
jgi:hypothetical protein